MKPAQSGLVILEYGAILVLALGIFAVDVMAPAGWAVWILYFLPLMLTFQCPRRQDTLYITGLLSLLTLGGFYFTSAGIDRFTELMNRAAGLIVMWAFAVAMFKWKQMQAEKVVAELGRQRAEWGQVIATAEREQAEKGAELATAGRRQAEERLLVSNLRLDGIVQSAMDAIITVDEGQRIVLFNQAAERMFRCEAKDAIGGSLDRFIPAQFREQHRQDVERFGASGLTSRKMGALGTVKGLRTGGDEFPVEAAISQVRVQGKHYYTVILRDITERERLKTEREEREALLRTIIETEPDSVTVFSPAGTVESMNAAGLAMIEGSGEEIVGQDLSRLVMPEYRASFQRIIAQASFGQAGRLEFELEGLKGTRRWLEMNAVPLRRPDGSTTGVLGVAHDNTQRRRTELLLRQSEERHRLLVEVSPDAIFVSRGDRIVFVNNVALRLFGAGRPEDMIGRSPFDFIHPDFQAMTRDRIRQLVESGQSVPLLEEKFVRLDGATVDVEVAAVRFFDQEGPAIQIVLRDITERRRLQEQLRRTERIAELGTLASGMAHEIGTPMNVILGRAEYLMERTSDETLKKGLQTIVTQVERITRVMNQLLAFARRRPVNRLPVDLRKILADCLEIFHERLSRHGIQVDVNADDTLPQAEADADQISQVLLNLIINAVHAMPEGGALQFGVSGDDGMVRLTVSDTGHGIAKEDMAKIFDPFFTTKEVGKGTGLGLTVVKGIMEEHGGGISVESEPGRGTVFTLQLPARKAKAMDVTP